MAESDYQVSLSNDDIKGMSIDFIANLGFALMGLAVLIIFIFMMRYLFKK